MSEDTIKELYAFGNKIKNTNPLNKHLPKPKSRNTKTLFLSNSIKLVTYLFIIVYPIQKKIIHVVKNIYKDLETINIWKFLQRKNLSHPFLCSKSKSIVKIIDRKYQVGTMTILIRKRKRMKHICIEEQSKNIDESPHDPKRTQEIPFYPLYSTSTLFDVPLLEE